MTDDGEIPLLDADHLGDHKNIGKEDVLLEKSDPDTRAIRNISLMLAKTPSGNSLSPDELEDKSIDLYNRFCELIRSGKANRAQIERAAEIFGEDAEKMQKRLAEDFSEDDLTGREEASGALGLLRALKG